MQMYKNLLNIILFYIKIKKSNRHKKTTNLLYSIFYTIIYFTLSKYFCHSQVVLRASSNEVLAFQFNSFSALLALA